MLESPESNIYPAGSMLKSNRDTELMGVRQDLKSEFNTDWLYLKDHSTPKEPELLLGIEAAACIDIKRRHKNAGIDLENNLPSVFVIPEEKWDEVTTHFKRYKGHANGFVISEGNVAVVKEKDSIFDTAYTMYHEMMHGVGRVAHVVGNDYIKKGQQGFLTKGPEKRGEVLEEGMAEFAAYDFMLNDTSPVLIKEREALVQKWYPRLTEPVTKEHISYATQSQMMLLSAREYNLARGMIARLVRAGGPSMEHLLLSARVDPGKTGELKDKINKTFSDNKTAATIYKTQFNEDSINDTMRFLYARMPSSS